MNEIFTILQVGFGFAAVWMLVYFGIRPYRIDLVRHELFELRNEWFLYAANGNIDFNNAVYRKLRSRLNALIRFAHMMTFTRAFLFGLQEAIAPSQKLVRDSQKLKTEMQELSNSNRQKSTDIYNRTHAIIAKHIVKGSPLLLAAAGVYFVAHKASSWFRTQQEDPAITIGKELRVDLIEEQAMLAQKQESELCELAQA